VSNKPYTVYKGGRVKGRVPLERRATAPSRDGRRDVPYRGPGARPVKERHWRRWVLLGVLVLFALITTWGVASYLAVRSGVEEANDRLGRPARQALTPQDGLLFSKSTSILLLGTDSAPTRARQGLRHTDSMMLVTTDPDHNRIYYLAIPRDLRVVIPGHGTDKVNVAFQIGGPRLAVRTVREYTGLPVNHLVIVDFARFEKLIDAIGGVTVNVPRPILSNRFDCPYRTSEQCSRWDGWRFDKGKHELNGRRALIYSRIRTNRLDPRETDVDRTARQQAVLDAVGRELTSFGTLIRLPWVGDDVMKPLATDLTTGEFIQLGWRRFRSGSDRAINCRLGGEPQTIGGGSYIAPDEATRLVIATIRGDSAPQPPPPDNPRYGSGCVVGKPLGVAKGAG
jgi:polyisoprenyl-teichoic acid--peptidoglycan teichoic acid transferase